MEYRMDIVKTKIKCVSLNLLFLRYKTKNVLRSLPILHMNFVKSGYLSEFSSKYGNRKMQFDIEYGDMEIRFYSTEVKPIEDMKNAMKKRMRNRQKMNIENKYRINI